MSYLQRIKGNHTKVREPDSQKDHGVNDYAVQICKLKKKIPHWDIFFDRGEGNQDSRDRLWPLIDELQTNLCSKYAWAIPDGRALNILRFFSPLIEIGAGKGYWASLLMKQNVDIIAFDKFAKSTGNWTPVLKGCPKKLQKEIAARRNLFLCYPYEMESVASPSLEYFSGEYVIHVGELMTTGTLMGSPTAPFGRTSSADFQIMLAEKFHCVLVAELKHRYPNSLDCISVWKRTIWIERPPDEPKSSRHLPSKGTKKGSKQAVQKEPPATSASGSSAVEFMSMKDLEALRNQSVSVASSSSKLSHKAKKMKLSTEKVKAVSTTGFPQSAKVSATAKESKLNTRPASLTSSVTAKSNFSSSSAALGGAVEFISMADLAKLREANAGKSVGVEVEEDEGDEADEDGDWEDDDEDDYDDDDDDDDDDDEDDDDVDSEDLKDGNEGRESAKVRTVAVSGKLVGRNDQQVSGEPQDVSSVLATLREVLLDCQYHEGIRSEWASVPADERLPVDRAAPAFAHLLVS